MYIIKNKDCNNRYSNLDKDFIYLKEIDRYGTAIWQGLKDAKIFTSEASARDYLRDRKVHWSWVELYCNIHYIHPLNVK